MSSKLENLIADIVYGEPYEEMTADEPMIIDDLKSQLKTLLLSVVPEEEDKITTEYDTSYRQGHNRCREEMLEALEELFK